MDAALPVTRDQLANDFTFEGTRFPLIDRGRGIRKPTGWDAALSITTSVPKSGQPRPCRGVDDLRAAYRLQYRVDLHDALVGQPNVKGSRVAPLNSTQTDLFSV